MPISKHLDETGKATREMLVGSWEGASPVDAADDGFQQLMSDFIYNSGMYSRSVVPQSTRELMAVICLTALYRPEELRAHIRIALKLAPKEQVQEAILQASVYGGFPSSMTGLRIFGEVLAETK